MLEQGSDDRPRFHLAFPVRDLEEARHFYAGVLGCRIGREDAHWIDFDFAGHQITAHLSKRTAVGATSRVDGDPVPIRHFGLILSREAWEALARRLEAAGVSFLIAPRVRFVGKPGEQATMFIRDPSGNALEFKAFGDDERIFARGEGTHYG
ncbi:MAG: VOC family protein [Nannocystaceae bacterium]